MSDTRDDNKNKKFTICTSTNENNKQINGYCTTYMQILFLPKETCDNRWKLTLQIKQLHFQVQNALL
jgi:hypothetical protein